MTIIWLAAMVVFAIIEAATLGITSVWFALGALAALISSLCGAQLWLQIVWFIVISGVTLAFGRRLLKKYFVPRRSSTNAERVLEMQGVVTECIDNLAGTGAAKFDGKIWTARAEDYGVKIEAGTVVEALRIEGVKLIVQPAAIVAAVSDTNN